MTALVVDQKCSKEVKAISKAARYRLYAVRKKDNKPLFITLYLLKANSIRKDSGEVQRLMPLLASILTLQ
jgi:hypothetical protein